MEQIEKTSKYSSIREGALIMNRKLNVFFAGKAGSGKTTLANYLVKCYGYKPAKFAYPVYMIGEKYFRMKKKDRHLLQIIGTEGGRSIDKEIWIKRLLEDIEIVEKVCEMEGFDTPFFVLDDCRFENEAQRLIDEGWVGIYLDCPDEIRYKRLYNRDGYKQERFDNHASEREVELCKNICQYSINTNTDIKKMKGLLDIILVKEFKKGLCL